MFRLITLPTHAMKEGPMEEEPEEAEGESEPGKLKLRSIEDSLVLLQALRQSRQTWLTSAFVKFSAKSRTGKGGDIWQPPHTIRFRGRCDLEIGPHVFYTTSVYEVTYQPYSVPIQSYAASSTSTPTQPSSNAPHIQVNSQTLASPSSTGTTTGNGESANSVVSSLSGTVPITNELIAQVNAAALSDPALAELLRVTAAGHATKEQLHTLGIRMQSLADAAKASQSNAAPVGSTGTPPQVQEATKEVTAISHTPSSATGKGISTTTPSTTQPPILSLRPPSSYPPAVNGPTVQQQASQTTQMVCKDPDVVIEFYENSADRWLLPKDLVLYEKVQRWDNNNTLADIIFSTIFPFEGSMKPSQSTQQVEEGQSAPTSPDFVHPITLRFFNVPLAIWNLFASAANNLERTKRVSAAIEAKLDKAAPRLYLQHQISDGNLLSQLQASAADRYPMKGIKPVPGTTGPAKRRTAPPKDGQIQKRRRTAPLKKTESRTGTCDICKRASIVLAPESPYCPPCTKKVAAGEVIPPTPSPASATLASRTTSVTPQDTQSKATTNLTASAPTPSVTTTFASTTSGVSQPPKAAPKPRKPRKNAAPPTFKTPTVPAPYPPGVRPPLPNYYTWQPGAHYTYYQHPSTLQPGQPPGSNPLPVLPPYPSIYAQAGQAAVQQAYPGGVPPALSPASVRPSNGSDTRVTATAAPADKTKDKTESSSGSHPESPPEKTSL